MNDDKEPSVYNDLSDALHTLATALNNLRETLEEALEKEERPPEREAYY